MVREPVKKQGVVDSMAEQLGRVS